MALNPLFTDGMAHYDTSTVYNKYDTIAPFTQVAVSQTGGANNRPYLQVRFGNVTRNTIILADTSWIVGMRINNVQSAEINTNIYFAQQAPRFSNTAQRILYVQINSDQTIGIFFDNGVPITGSSIIGGTALPPGSWQYLEFQFSLISQKSVGASQETIWGTAEIRIASQLVSSPIQTDPMNYIDSGIISDSTIYQDAAVDNHIFFGDFQYMDIYIIASVGGSNVGYYNDCRIESRFPDNDGSETDWSGSFATLNHNPPTDSGGIVPISLGDNFSNYFWQSLSPSFSGTLAAVMLWGLAEGDGTSFVFGYLGDPHNFIGNGAQPGSQQFYYWPFGFDKDYDTTVEAPWTFLNFNAQAFGFKAPST